MSARSRQRGLPIASQAGKGLFRRQEVQDLLALARVLADAARHARLRRADARPARRPDRGGTARHHCSACRRIPIIPTPSRAFRVLTDPDHVTHPVARRALVDPARPRRRVRARPRRCCSWPRPPSAWRSGPSWPRAKAIAAHAPPPMSRPFLERARPYGVKGLKRFVRDLSRDWRTARSLRRRTRRRRRRRHRDHHHPQRQGPRMAGRDPDQHRHFAALARAVRASHRRRYAALDDRRRRPAGAPRRPLRPTTKV